MDLAHDRRRAGRAHLRLLDRRQRSWPACGAQRRWRRRSRLLSFEASDIALELEIVIEGDKRRLVGQIVPAQPGVVEVQHRRGAEAVEADAVGRFSVASIAPGLFRLTVAPRATRTRWRRPGSRCDDRGVTRSEGRRRRGHLGARAGSTGAGTRRRRSSRGSPSRRSCHRRPRPGSGSRGHRPAGPRDDRPRTPTISERRSSSFGRAVRSPTRAGLARLGAEARMSLALRSSPCRATGMPRWPNATGRRRSSPASPVPASRPSGPPSSTSSWAAPTTPSPATRGPSPSCIGPEIGCGRHGPVTTAGCST